MKQWVTFILGFLSFLAVALMILIIILGNKPFSAVEKQAIDRVESEELIAEVDRAYVYSNSQTSVTVIGTDLEGKAKAAFVPSGDGEIEAIDLEDKVTAKEAREIALKEMDVKDILHTKLGMETEGPVWEIAFINKEDQLNYVYILAKDGTWWKRILNL
ncbi:uncharacterized protein YpmB [Planomicrobium soli]|uniref:Uncharacterized protein YpmB n=1 Tax=Planomicrobium soli TaxID=1176648 RepID=A0A2P8H6X9_9BACL|nr:DUF5590 domain-containing protein [Planomicrobium soli]PSL41951.1 uncharacterized protein YpmB [Planomicrobium soli]